MTEVQQQEKLAFSYVKPHQIRPAVLALIEKLGLTQGSIVANASPGRSYNFYQLLEAYIFDPEFRVEIHRMLEARHGLEFGKR